MLDMDAIYREHAELVYRYLLSLCGDSDTAEELTQETFFRAVYSSGRFEGRCRVSTWLCQIAKHVWYQELERRRRRSTEPLSADLPSRERGPDESILLYEEKMELFKRVHILGETAKEVVLLRIAGAFSFREIGELFGKNENWARVTYYRAKQKIMEGWEDGYEV